MPPTPCAVWTGVRLRDVLKAAGLEDDDPNVNHIQVGSATRLCALECGFHKLVCHLKVAGLEDGGPHRQQSGVAACMGKAWGNLPSGCALTFADCAQMIASSPV